MKKVITLLLTAVLAVSALAGCGSNAGTAGNAGSGDKTKRTLSVATSPDFPPFESLDGTKLIGIEVELMDMIAEKMDVNIEYVYAFTAAIHGSAYVVFRVDDVEGAEAILARKGLKTLNDEDLSDFLN